MQVYSKAKDKSDSEAHNKENAKDSEKKTNEIMNGHKSAGKNKIASMFAKQKVTESVKKTEVPWLYL